MQSELIEQLQTLGFSQKEAQVYLASLELGEATTQDIANHARVSRPTTYLILETLLGRGLMSTWDDGGGRRLYRAASPEKLTMLIEAEERKMEEKKRGIKQMIPMLFALGHSQDNKPHIQYLEGEEGVMAVRQIFLEQEGDAFQIVPLDDVGQMKLFEGSREPHLETFAKKGGTMRALLVGDTQAAKSLPVFPGVVARVIPKERFPIHGEITVRANTIFLYAYKDTVTAVIVTNKELAQTLKALFEQAWKGAEEFPGIGEGVGKGDEGR